MVHSIKGRLSNLNTIWILSHPSYLLVVSGDWVYSPLVVWHSFIIRVQPRIMWLYFLLFFSHYLVLWLYNMSLFSLPVTISLGLPRNKEVAWFWTPKLSPHSSRRLILIIHSALIDSLWHACMHAMNPSHWNPLSQERGHGKWYNSMTLLCFLTPISQSIEN